MLEELSNANEERNTFINQKLNELRLHLEHLRISNLSFATGTRD
jgi:hypothetical protein